MPLSLFNYQTRTHYREVRGSGDTYEHSFGGNPASYGIRFTNSEPLHLVYRLNQADPKVDADVPGVEWLPLCYHFRFASCQGELIYRVLNDREIEVIAPVGAELRMDFPYEEFPNYFAPTAVKFKKVRYDPRIAEDALSLAAVFGVDQLSEEELARAIEIAERTSGTISSFGSSDPEPADVVRVMHREPFTQGAPSKSCDNPDCSAEVAYRTETMTVAIDSPEFREVTGKSSLTIEGRDVRRDSMRVFAIHQPDRDDRVWPGVQLVFEVCECCHCIRVTNQRD